MYKKWLLWKSRGFVLTSLHTCKTTVRLLDFLYDVNFWDQVYTCMLIDLCNSLLVVLHIRETKYWLHIQHRMVQWWHSACWGVWEWTGYLCSCDWKVSKIKYCWCQVLVLWLFVVSSNYLLIIMSNRKWNFMFPKFYYGWFSPPLLTHYEV